MVRIALLVAAAYLGLIGVYILAAPEHFYLTTPGVVRTGPYNSHFLRDVGFAFFISGAALGWGASMSERSVAIAGALWPAAHGAFHLQIWAARGCAPDVVGVAEFATITLPSFLTLWLAFRWRTRRPAARYGDG